MSSQNQGLGSLAETAKFKSKTPNNKWGNATRMHGDPLLSIEEVRQLVTNGYERMVKKYTLDLLECRQTSGPESFKRQQALSLNALRFLRGIDDRAYLYAIATNSFGLMSILDIVDTAEKVCFCERNSLHRGSTVVNRHLVMVKLSKEFRGFAPEVSINEVAKAGLIDSVRKMAQPSANFSVGGRPLKPIYRDVIYLNDLDPEKVNCLRPNVVTFMFDENYETFQFQIGAWSWDAPLAVKQIGFVQLQGIEEHRPKDMAEGNLVEDMLTYGEELLKNDSQEEPDSSPVHISQELHAV